MCIRDRNYSAVSWPASTQLFSSTRRLCDVFTVASCRTIDRFWSSVAARLSVLRRNAERDFRGGEYRSVGRFSGRMPNCQYHAVEQLHECQQKVGFVYKFCESERNQYIPWPVGLYIGWGDVTTYGHNTICMLRGHTAYCVKLSGEDLSRYSNKIESVGLRKCEYYHYLTKKVMSQ